MGGENLQIGVCPLSSITKCTFYSFFNVLKQPYAQKFKLSPPGVGPLLLVDGGGAAAEAGLEGRVAE